MGELKKVRAGESWRPDAKAHNAFVDAAQYVQRLQQTQAGNPVRGLWSGDVVQVKNMSGADRDRFDVLEIANVFPTPAANLGGFKAGRVFYGYVPGNVNNVVVLLEPIKSGKIGAALVSGICPVKVSFAYQDQPYADYKDGDPTALLGGEGGVAKVLWKENGTGVLWAVVRLGSPSYPTLFGQLDSPLYNTPYNFPPSVKMSIWTRTGYTGRKVDVSGLFVAYGQNVHVGPWVAADWFIGENAWVVTMVEGSMSLWS